MERLKGELEQHRADLETQRAQLEELRGQQEAELAQMEYDRVESREVTAAATATRLARREKRSRRSSL